VPDDSDGIEELHRRVRDGVSRLRGLEMGNELGVEILSRLVDGNRTVSEIVEQIYGVKSSEEGFFTCYTRTRREVRKLESKGLVSRSLLGRDRPYRLTNLAVINLARIGGREEQLRVVPRVDIATYFVTLVSAVPLVLIASEWVEFSQPVTSSLFGIFCVLLGISLCRFLQALRRVF